MFRTSVEKLTFSSVAFRVTGNNPYLGDRIYEIGSVRFNISSKINEFSTYINPGRPLPRRERYRTSITDELLAGSPTFSEIEEEFISFIDDTVLVFHDAPVWLSFLSMERSKSLENIVLDTKAIIRKRFNFREDTLLYLSKKLKIERALNHGALEDARAVSRIIRFIVSELKPSTLGDILTIQSGSVRILGFNLSLRF